MATKSTPRAKRRELKATDIEKSIADSYNKTDFNFKKRPFKLTENQKKLITIINDPSVKVVIIQGPAGTGKSWTATYCGLSLIKEQKLEKLLYVRAMVESAAKSMGYLPGSELEKTMPYNSIIFELVGKLIVDEDIPKIKKGGIVDTMPVNHARGHTWDNMFVLVDEAQQMETKELLTVMSRIGENTKLVLTGDKMQPDIKTSGFEHVYNTFNDEDSLNNGIVTFEFDEDDIVRSEILKFIIRKFKAIS